MENQSEDQEKDVMEENDDEDNDKETDFPEEASETSQTKPQFREYVETKEETISELSFSKSKPEYERKMTPAPCSGLDELD